MTEYVPPNTLPFSTVLARLAEAWTPAEWNAAAARETAVLLGEDLHAFQRGLALRPGSVAAKTFDQLRPILADGRLPTLLHVEVGPPRLIPPTSWQSDGAGNLGRLLAGTVDFAMEGGAIERGTVLVAEDALTAVLEGRPMPTPATVRDEPVTAPAPKRSRGGRPKSYDDVEFVIIAARIAFEDSPANQARLTAAALDEYASTLPAGMEPPSEEWARPLVRRLWNGLGLERTDRGHQC